MRLNVSRNILSDDALRALAELVSKFEGIRSLDLREIRPSIAKKGKDVGYQEFAKAIRENKAIVELDLRDN